jgi:polyhydroxyalkanoate synthesis regulator phasin
MAEPGKGENGRPLGERLALAALGALATSTSPAELRELLTDVGGRVRGDAERLSERAGDALTDLYRELGLVSREEYEELELRLAQLEHRLRLLEGVPGPRPPAA